MEQKHIINEQFFRIKTLQQYKYAAGVNAYPV